MFEMPCPLDCGEVLESENRDGILRVYDQHRAANHAMSPAQWTEMYNRIEEGKERAKKRQG